MAQSAPQELPQETAALPRPPALGRVVSGAMSFGTVATLVTKIAGFAVQAVLGWTLTKQDFGIFATAVAVSGFMAVMRDAGMRDLLVQRGLRGYKALATDVFWLAMVFNTLCGLGIALAAWPLAKYVYHEPRLTMVLLVISLSLPLCTVGSVLSVRQRLDLRFNTSATLGTIAVIARYLLTVVLALAWPNLGALVMAIPIALHPVFDGLLLLWSVPDRPWKKRPRIRVWRPILARTKWLMFSAIANVGLDLGPYLIMGALMSKSAVGVYYFAFQLTAQLGAILSWQVQHLMTPVFGRLMDDPGRLREAVARSLRAVLLVGCVSCLMLAALIEPVERLVWRTRWDDAILPVLVLGLFYPWRLTLGVGSAAYLAAGRFKRYAFMLGFEGLGLVVVSTIGAILTPSALGMAFWTGGWLMIGRVVVLTDLCKILGLSRRSILGDLTYGWLVSVAAGVATLAVFYHTLPGTHLVHLIPSGLSPGLRDTIVHGVDVMAISIVGGVAFALAARVCLSRWLLELLGVTPGRLHRPIETMLRLRQS